jgi:hypothetical protein
LRLARRVPVRCARATRINNADRADRASTGVDSEAQPYEAPLTRSPMDVSLAFATTVFTNTFNRFNDTEIDFPAAA